MEIQLGLIQTTTAALIILFVGYFLNEKIAILKKNNIPEPVVGGIAFAIVSTILYSQFEVSFAFDMTLKKPLMLMFFTTVGLGASFSLLKKGGPKVILFLGIASLYLVIQNGVGVGLASLTDMNPLIGMLSGSITLSGGHGTGATYADMFAKSQNLQGGMELAMACATFGLVLGGLIGGPVTRRLIQKHDLKPDAVEESDSEDGEGAQEEVGDVSLMFTLLILGVCIVLGTYIYEFLKAQRIPLPSFICPLLVGIAITNICDYSGIYKINKKSVSLLGNVSLSIFLAMALMSLRLWELLNLAGPMLIVLLIQTIILMLYTTYVTFPAMGKDYNAAIIAGGHCGFGLGATPTAVANMEALVAKYGPSPQAFLVVPMVGAFFIDITNTIIIQIYLSLPFVS